MSNLQQYQTYECNEPQPAGLTGPVGVTLRIGGNVERETYVDGVLTTDTQKQVVYSSAQNNPYHGTDSVLATARTKTGRPAEVVTADCLVTINGMEADVAFWEKEGFLTKHPDGTYTEAAPQQQAQQEGPADLFPMPDALMGTVNEAIEPLPQSHLDGLTARVIGAATGATDLDAAVSLFTQATGLPPEDSRARVHAVLQAYQSHAEQAIQDNYGLPMEAMSGFWQWARANHRQELQSALGQQVHQHQHGGFKSLAARYMAATPPTRAAFERAGVPIRGQGASMEVQLQGRWWTPAGAAKAGLV